MHSDISQRNNVQVIGQGQKTLMLAHGFGCDQTMWRFLVPRLSETYRIVLFDYVGSGNSELSAFSQERYSSLEGYAADIVEICQALELHDVALLGHSVSGTIGLLALQSAPELFSSLMMVCPSPCFLNKPPDYHGGFEREDLEGLLDLMDKNYIGWANYLAPLVMGAHSSELLQGELAGSFCSTDPIVARLFARATFFSDYRHLLSEIQHPSLILQSQTDSLAPMEVGHYMHRQMPNSYLEIIDAEGHCLHMTDPEAVLPRLEAFLSQSRTEHG